MIDYNVNLLNRRQLESSYFFLNRDDPTVGFPFDASSIVGHAFPPTSVHQVTPMHSTKGPLGEEEDQCTLHLKLVLGSHLAQHLRSRLEEARGYTSTVGISTTKLISKLVGNVNKPKGQTTLLPPYSCPAYEGENNVVKFLDDHDIGKVPGIGFKMSQKIRQHVLGREAAFESGLVYGATKERIRVKDIRLFPGMGPQMLEKILDGPGVPKDVGDRVWSLINGVDNAEVAKAKEIPQQISIEDSYIRLNTMEDVLKELKMLSRSLLKRMRIDLTSTSTSDSSDEPLIDIKAEAEDHAVSGAKRQWLAYPRSLRLTTRPRPPLKPDGTRGRLFNRISRSGAMPAIVFNLEQGIEVISEKLVSDSLIPLFHKLHPEKSDWDLSLVNLCATNMALIANDTKEGPGRDIKRMFIQQDEVLKQWKVHDFDMPFTEQVVQGPDEDHAHSPISDLSKTDLSHNGNANGSENISTPSQESTMEDDTWADEDTVITGGDTCGVCGAVMPPFAMIAHERFHELPD